MIRHYPCCLPLLLLVACAGPSQYTANAIYDARAQIANVERSGAQEFAPESLQDAKRMLSEAENAYADGDGQKALRYSHYALRLAEHAALLMAQYNAERRARIAEIDLSEAREREQDALREREQAEQELEQATGRE